VIASSASEVQSAVVEVPNKQKVVSHSVIDTNTDIFM
jgi:hypothetical protein